MKKRQLFYWLVRGNIKKQQNKLVEWKAFVDAVTRVAINLKNTLLF